MDLLCPKCGEPWDFDSIHDRVKELNPTQPWKIDGEPYSQSRYDVYYKPVASDFRTRGCVALGSTCGEPSADTDRVFGLTRTQAASTMYELLGDDMDGAAAMLEDMGF